MQEPLDHPPPIHSDHRTPRPLPPPRAEYALLALAGLAVLAIGVWSWWDWRQPAPAPLPPSAAAPAAAVSPSEQEAGASQAAVRYPVEPVAAASAAALPLLDESDLELARRIEQLVGRQGLALVRSTGLVRHLVATVDNLPRGHASPQVWPVDPTEGRFSVLQRDGRTVISPDNELRYAPFVLLVESADTERVLALYRWAYPLFQQAYEELGHPGRHFNDRLVEVIDHLLAAPEPAGPVVVEPAAAEGSRRLARPWAHYVYADPALESLSAGQKLMVRVGLVQERRLKAQLRKLRAALVQLAPAAR